MQKYKRIGLYGVSGAGKSTILSEVSKLSSKVVWLEGSKLITKVAGSPLRQFKKLKKKEQEFIREKAIEKAWEIQKEENKHIIIDGHLVFPKSEIDFENVMTNKDRTFYTHFIYLNIPPEIIFERHKLDQNRIRNYSKKTISNWINFELKELTCHCRNSQIDLQILHSTNKEESVEFILNYFNS